MKPDQPPTALPRPEQAYSSTVQAMHWVGAFVLIAAWGLGVSMDLFPRGPARGAALQVHATLGLLVLTLTVLRILWRGATKAPAPEGPAWMVPLAHAGHAALYVLTIALPVSGLLGRWARQGSAALIGGLSIPTPFALPRSKLWGEAHEVIAFMLAALVVAHIAAALVHHLVLRDGILRRMLPVPPR